MIIYCLYHLSPPCQNNGTYFVYIPISQQNKGDCFRLILDVVAFCVCFILINQETLDEIELIKLLEDCVYHFAG